MIPNDKNFTHPTAGDYTDDVDLENVRQWCLIYVLV